MTDLQGRLKALIDAHLEATGSSATALAKAAGMSKVRLSGLRNPDVSRPGRAYGFHPRLEEVHALLGVMGLGFAALDSQPPMTTWLDVADGLHTLGMPPSMIAGIRAMQIQERRWREQKEQPGFVGVWQPDEVPFS